MAFGTPAHSQGTRDSTFGPRKNEGSLGKLAVFFIGGRGGVGETPEEGHRQEFLCFFSSCRIVGLQIGGRSERNF